MRRLMASKYRWMRGSAGSRDGSSEGRSSSFASRSNWLVSSLALNTRKGEVDNTVTGSVPEGSVEAGAGAAATVRWRQSDTDSTGPPRSAVAQPPATAAAPDTTTAAITRLRIRVDPPLLIESLHPPAPAPTAGS